MHKSRLDDGSVLVAFELPAAVAADSVSLVGDFNDWSPAANPLARQEDGHFRTELRLPAGQRARFRYLLDGRRWENDWAADDYVPNGLGADDSVVDLTDVASIAAVAVAPDLATAPDLADAVPVVAEPSPTEPPAEPTDAEPTDAEPTDAELTDTPAQRRWWQFWRRPS